ncbi:putative iclR family transcriptional regulator [Microlunatus phosphovorus NM-1]|uniref:Putative iclR family transcriptional regulator n=1 Tax=Microlunatus phosphovorus (strain ATCC 700054 / DSM 10555 / JCM 9379 / NBRC 101784 / NCIMB 13414 / VKM Ac-1990 / NM-1) TaxID=1032480 RepID=F5XFG6_MICPN|nr:IclR family transcriptional regulator [Microlunatus phosphovorus]BAK35373.1 putative iclR family transcriptional regulator [Microlunatus phosphovorus NM-1]
MSVERPMGILQRSDALVRLLAEEGALTPAEIAERIDTPRPTVYRLADALARMGLTETLPGTRIALSRRWLRLGDAARSSMSEWQLARPILDGLAASTGQTVFLCVPRGREGGGQEAVCIDCAQGQAFNVLLLKPGRALPLHAGAEGRVTLAYGVSDVEQYLVGAPFAAYNLRTLVTAEELRRDIAETRDRGFSISDEDVTDGIGALGAPLRTSRTGAFAGALSIVGLADRLTARRVELAEALLDAADALSATLP